ncbi:PilZ domain-containing protein [Bradyrhizobium betae]
MERRGDQRHRVLKKGSIEFGGSAIDCSIRNISDAGAMLEVESPLGIPREFTLVVPADTMRRNCRVAWIKEKRLGVEFKG